MISAPILPDEFVRLRHLYEYDILDSPAEEDYDEIVRLASNICGVPISLISLIDVNRQWFKARTGLEVPETTRDVSFCTHALQNGDDLFVVPDATQDERFFDNPLVTGYPDIRFYAGIPLVSPRGARLGALCVIDRVPRNLEENQQATLRVLGKQVVKLMELRKINMDLSIISRKEKEQRLELERVAERQQKMISILAHDIRSPLSALKSLLELIPKKDSGLGKYENYLDLAGNQLDVTLALLENIVDWGQLQLRPGQPEERRSLFEIAAAATFDCSIQAGLKGLKLVNRVPVSANFLMEGDKLHFVLRNLLTNAIKFSASGSIFIDGGTGPEGTILQVKDAGTGMSSETVAQLFRNGRRVTRKGTAQEAGSGLGLSLVKEFTDQMGGQITVESELGRGTVVSIRFPPKG